MKSHSKTSYNVLLNGKIKSFIHDQSLIRKVGRYTKGVIRNLNLKMKRQYNSQQKKIKKTNNERQYTT